MYFLAVCFLFWKLARIDTEWKVHFLVIMEKWSLRVYVDSIIWIEGPHAQDATSLNLLRPSDAYMRKITFIGPDQLTIIGSDNGLSPGRHQAIIWYAIV